MNSILITGGTGTLGNALTERLLTREVRRICIFSRGEKAQAEMARKFQDNRMRFFIGDVRDYRRLLRAADGCDLVIHAAALKRIEAGVENPDEMFKTNVQGSLNVVDAARWTGARKVILVSSDKAFEPVSPYGNSKALAEALFLARAAHRYPSHPLYSVVRYGNVWKSAGSVVPIWRAALAEGRQPTLTDPDCTRFFMLVTEAVDFILAALEKTGPKTLKPFIPDLPAYCLRDLALAMSLRLPFRCSGLPAHEKLHESMEVGKSSKDARRMSVNELLGHL